MRKFKYVGPADAVDLEGVGTVERGRQIEVEDPAVSASLDEQADWEHVPATRKRAARKRVAKKAAASLPVAPSAEVTDPSDKDS